MRSGTGTPPVAPDTTRNIPEPPRLDPLCAAARLTGLLNPSGQSWSWQYQNNDWLLSQSDNNLINAAYTRNARGIITDLKNTLVSNGSTLSEYSVTAWDANGNPGTLAASVPAAPGFSGSTTYVHDALVQLTSENSTRNGGYSNAFAYDGAGNATTFRGATQSYNADNQNTVSGFDGAGNPTTYKGASLTFDAENRMTAYGSTLTAGYRGDGLRAYKQSSSATTYFYYDGMRPVFEENSSGAVTAVNTFGPAGFLARTSSTRTLLYTRDAQGCVSQQYDASSGALAASYLFDAYGNRSSSSNDQAAIAEPFTGFDGIAGYYT
ncbi:MAG: hypothetical protein ACREQ5_34485, partial [Candidatus Dormibacteria bacterium]